MEVQHSRAAAAYMQDLRRYPVLTDDELRELMPRVKKGDANAVARVAQGNLRFVVKVALEFRNTGLPLEELIAEGNAGLMKAVTRFDPDRGHKFSTYAVWWIRQSIRRALQRHGRPVRVPVNRLDDLQQIRRAQARMAQDLGRGATEEELASDLNITPERTRAALEVSDTAVSLDAPIRQEEQGSYMDLQPSGVAPPDASIIEEQSRVRLREAVSQLSPRDAEVISMSFGLSGEDLNLREVGDRLGISKERARQLRNRALEELRQRLTESGVSIAAG